MSSPSDPRLGSVLARLLLGTVLVTWRYLWQITPLHRVEQAGQLGADEPPRIPAEFVDEAVQLADHGVGPLFHRRFSVRITGTRSTASGLMGKIADDFKRFVPKEVVDVRTPTPTERTNLEAGDEFVVQMPGPWDGPVRVVHLDPTCLRLATLRGHLEAGQVQFHAEPRGDDLVFSIEAWARPSTRTVHLLYSYLRVAKEIQLNMWVRFCQAAAKNTGGRPRDGVHIRTHCLHDRARKARVRT